MYIIFSDLELPSISSTDEDISKGHSSAEGGKAVSAAQNIPGEASQSSHGVVTSPPKSLSVVSSLTDSDPPSPTEPQTKPPAESSDASIPSSLPSSLGGMQLLFVYMVIHLSYINLQNPELIQHV